ncbi:hypothetical protein C8N24_0187 [Solirubrobacter pauli]|uniref:SMI1/KNR4 family protein SUKH-1 n=1 Tax=Solirubrobacter pauli TaxID=166793 RepID=A0A660L803_9ACTN|nr:hypothetical protein C8N24_0187 [Solirubrobacter pauli]
MVSADVPPWRPPTSLEALQQLEAEIAPMRLPDQVRRLWTLVDAASLRVHTWPRIIPPSVALVNWRQTRDDFEGRVPLVLVDVGYENLQTMSIELDVDELPGGALFEWDVSGDEFTRRFNQLADWIDYVALLIRRGIFNRADRGDGPVLEVPGYPLHEAEIAMRTVPGEHPVHGRALDVDTDSSSWPVHWQRVNQRLLSA